MVLHDIETLDWKHLPKKLHNLPNEEHEALYKLRKNRELIFKEADKGGATVVMNKTDYMDEAFRQLNDTAHYIKLDNDSTFSLKKEIDDYIMEDYNNSVIDNNVKDVLTTDHPWSRFVSLAKDTQGFAQTTWTAISL